MAVVSAVLDTVQKVASPIAGLIDDLVTSDSEREELKIRMQEVLQTTLTAELEAKSAVLQAELSQGDPFTKRARPAVVYAGLAFIFLNHVLSPIVAAFGGLQIPNLALPGEFWWAWFA